MWSYTTPFIQQQLSAAAYINTTSSNTYCYYITLNELRVVIHGNIYAIVCPSLAVYVDTPKMREVQLFLYFLKILKDYGSKFFFMNHRTFSGCIST